MGLIELVIIVIIIAWVLGGLVVFPLGGGLLNLLIAIVIIWIIYTLIRGR